MGKLGEDPPLTMDYLEAVRQKVRVASAGDERALLSEIRRLQRLILLAAHYTRTVIAPGGSVQINKDLLDDLHRQCMAEPIVVKDLARKRRLLAPARLPKDEIPLRAASISAASANKR